jgi:predicted AAA+ superfamily ATPase
MIKRDIEQNLMKVFHSYAVISITGPRQSGKTTLSQAIFNDFFYINLEKIVNRNFAIEDPQAFLNQSNKMIIDEIQHVPDLLSYIQTIVDEDPNRQFIITGSQNLLISEKVSQSLAGRVNINKLLPLSIRELRESDLLEKDLNTQIFKGFYPKIFDKDIDPNLWYNDYIQTYIERDVRQIKNIGDLSLFQKFMSLLAGRTGQILNTTSLANDVGISVNTVESWISILEASYLVFRLQPYYENYNKRLTKSPKIHFYDSGVVCALLGITSRDQLLSHPLIGNIFESFVISDIVKNSYNESQRLNFYYWRENHGKEIDLLYTEGNKTYAYEIKYGQTLNSDMASNLLYFKELSRADLELKIIYGGDKNQKRTEYSFVSWKDL